MHNTKMSCPVESARLSQSEGNIEEGNTMGVNPIVDYNFTQAQLVDRLNALKPQGYRPLSLGAHGNDSDHPRFAAVWDKRSGPSWRPYINYRFNDFGEECNRGAADGYYPVLIAAVGGGANRTISGVLEQIGPLTTTELTVDQDLKAFSKEVTKRAKNGCKCQSLFYAEVSMGVCPAGGARVRTSTSNYSVAGL
jgi:hypothetical protein